MAATLRDYEVRIFRYNVTFKQYVKVDQQMKVGEQDENDDHCTRYLVSESGAIGFEVKLKEGFVYGTATGIAIRLVDTNTKKLITQVLHRKPYPDQIAERLYLESHSNQHPKIWITSVSEVVVDGTRRTNVAMKLSPISPNDLDDSNEVRGPGSSRPGRSPNPNLRDAGGIEIEISKYTVIVIQESKSDLEKKVQGHNHKLLNAQPTDTLPAFPIHDQDQDHWRRSGISHLLRLDGGKEAPQLGPVSVNSVRKLRQLSNKAKFSFLWRSSTYLKENCFRKTPIALIYQPWDFLSMQDREECFVSLQEYDKKQCLQRQLERIKRERRPEKEIRFLEQQFQENPPFIWRKWARLFNLEKKSVFIDLQLRREFLDRGEVPPELPPLKISIAGALSKKKTQQEHHILQAKAASSNPANPTMSEQKPGNSSLDVSTSPQPPVPPNPDRPFKCFYENCDKWYPNRKGVKDHIWKKHRDQSLIPAAIAVAQATPAVPADQAPFPGSSILDPIMVNEHSMTGTKRTASEAARDDQAAMKKEAYERHLKRIKTEPISELVRLQNEAERERLTLEDAIQAEKAAAQAAQSAAQVMQKRIKHNETLKQIEALMAKKLAEEDEGVSSWCVGGRALGGGFMRGSCH